MIKRIKSVPSYAGGPLISIVLLSTVLIVVYILTGFKFKGRFHGRR